MKPKVGALSDAGKPERAARRLCRLALVVGALLLGGCVVNPHYASVASRTARNAKTDEFNQMLAVMAGQAASQNDYTIGPEDLLEVTLFDIEDTNGTPRLIATRVSNTGFVTLPYVGRVKAGGYSPLGFEDTLRKQFRHFIHEPQVSVFVREYRSYRVSVVGFVTSPGVLELRGRKTLLEAIAMSGGLNDDAGRSVRITRQADKKIQTILIDLDQLARGGDMKLNLALLPGDVISVPRAGIFFVEGEVKKPGAYPLLQQTTVSQALATAGGPDVKLAKVSGITLFRKGENGERKPIRINIGAIRLGKAEDFAVVEDDVIFVPLSGTKYFFQTVAGRFGIGFSAPL